MEIILKSSDIAYLKDAKDYSKCHIIVENADDPVLSWHNAFALGPVLNKIELHEAATHDSELFILGGLISRDDVTAVNMGTYEPYAKQSGSKAKFVTWTRKDSTKNSTRKQKKTVASSKAAAPKKEDKAAGDKSPVP